MGYGFINVGHVADCDRRRLERMLRDYDKQLYLKWNPKKREGRGIWEVRRLPNHKSTVSQGEFLGGELFTAEYVESDLINHVLDVPVLSYDILGRIKQMDAWEQKNFVANNDYEIERLKDKRLKTAREELSYNLRQNKRVLRETREALARGQNLGQLLKGFKLP